MAHKAAVGILLSALLLLPGMTPLADTLSPQLSLPGTATPTEATVAEAYGRLPLTFMANNVQTDPSVLYYAHVSGGKVYLTRDSIVLDLARREKSDASDMVSINTDIEQDTYQRLVLKLNLEGASSAPLVTCRDMAEGKVNYFIGNDPSKWVTDIPTYKEIIYSNIYPNIDLRFYGNEGALTYDFIVHPGGNVDDIRLTVEGSQGLDVSGRELVLNTAFGPLKQNRLSIYQGKGKSRNNIAGNFRLLDDNSYGFMVAAYSPNVDLIIDPSLVYSTFLGGSQYEQALGIAVDASGAAYIVGSTKSTDFPTTAGAYDTSHVGNDEAFVAKINSTGSSLVYCTYLGGSSVESGMGITVNASGEAYVTGYTESTDFPTKAGAYDTSHNGSSDAFVTKLNAAGSSIIYSTYLGSNGFDEGDRLAIDASGSAYIGGFTDSNNFPTTVGAYDTSHNGNIDVFVTKLNPTGSALTYSTFVGGSSIEYDYGLSIDASGSAYVAGWTTSTDFPTTPGAYDISHNGGNETFITKFNPAGSSLSYSSYLGGSNTDRAYALTVDSSGAAYVTGYTSSTDFPTTPGAYDTSYNGNNDIFITKFNPSGSSLAYSTYLGGSVGDYGQAIAVDPSGASCVTGYIYSIDFPTTTDAFDNSHNGNSDAFVAMLNPNGSTLIYSTYLGGVGNNDTGYGIAVSGSGAAYITGRTNSNDFPTTAGAWDTSNNGNTDVFVTRFQLDDSPQINTATGTGIATFSTSAGSIIDLKSLTLAEVDCRGLSTRMFPHGLFSFNVVGIAPGSTVTITITFPSAMARGTQYRKCINGRWVNLKEVLGDDDGDNVLTLTITDGSQYDADGQANGTIVDPGGPCIEEEGIPTFGGAEGASTGESSATILHTANLRVAMLNVPGQARVNQPITISANVVNDGSETGSTRVALKINGQVEQTKVVTVGGGSSRPVSFTVSKAEPGTYRVIMGSQRASFVVTGDGASSEPTISQGTMVLLIAGFLVVAFIIILAFAFRRKPTY